MAKNLIWTTLKGNFFNILIFLHPQIPDVQIAISVKYRPIITNQTSMESLFIQLLYDL